MIYRNGAYYVGDPDNCTHPKAALTWTKVEPKSRLSWLICLECGETLGTNFNKYD